VHSPRESDDGIGTIDDTSLEFRLDQCSTGALLARLTLKEGSVTGVSMEGGDRRFAQSRLGTLALGIEHSGSPQVKPQAVERKGSITVQAGDLANPQRMHSIDVSFGDDAPAAFAEAPSVQLTVKGAVPLAVSVDKVEVGGFMVHAFAVIEVDASLFPIFIEWRATTY
jgi:hypothetical protein